MTEETTLVRVRTQLVEEYRKAHPQLSGLSFSGVVEVMLRELMELLKIKEATPQ